MFELEKLRQAFGRFPTGVTIVTTKGEDGKLYGFTANSFTSVSLNPPLVLICPGKHLSSFAHFEKAEYFSISILAEGQEAISTHFATFKGNRFDNDEWEEDGFGAAKIRGAAATFSCKMHQRIDAGDHMILVGEVQDFSQTDKRGLGFLSGRYFNLGLERQAQPSKGKQNIAGVILEHEGHIYLQDHHLPKYHYDVDQDPRKYVIEQLNKLGLNAHIGAVYSLFHSDDEERHYIFYLARCLTPPEKEENFISINELSQLETITATEKIMLNRFAIEYQHRNFGLYIGKESQGEIR